MSNTQSHLIVTEEGLKIYKDDPASAILCEDQERASNLIWKSHFPNTIPWEWKEAAKELLEIGSIYPVPGIEFEPVHIDCKLDDCWFTEKCTHYLNPEKCHSKTVARLIEHTAEKHSIHCASYTSEGLEKRGHIPGKCNCKSESPEIDKEEEQLIWKHIYIDFRDGEGWINFAERMSQQFTIKTRKP